MSNPEAFVITRYFEADAHRDIDAIVALFTEEAVVVDEGQTYHGTAEIRGWQESAASKDQYTAQVSGTERIGEQSYLVDLPPHRQLPRWDRRAEMALYRTE